MDEIFENVEGKKLPFRTPYIPFKRDDGIKFDDPSLTKQYFAKECDINSIVDKFNKTGLLDINRAEPIFGDFSDSLSYMDALNVVMRAEEQFMSLDARIRAKFGNDPEKFLSFVEDPKNVDELVNLGLATKSDVVKTTSDVGTTTSNGDS